MPSAYHDSAVLWKNLLRAGLEDDAWPWDWTTLGVLPVAVPPAAATGRARRRSRGTLRARVVAKAPGVWVGEGLVAATNALADELWPGENRGDWVAAKAPTGARIKPGQVVAAWQGPARGVLALERPFLNLASYAGGIATQTRELVDLVTRACPHRTPRVTSTRKTLPAYRDLAVLGVQAGGGYAHRVSLSGGVLLKENHIAFAGSIARAIAGARGVAPHGLKIEVEVRSLRELGQALAAGADAVLLDNFDPSAVGQALVAIARARESGGARPVVEVSGGLNRGNIAHYALEGVDVLSVGSLTHSVTALDLSLLVDGT